MRKPISAPTPSPDLPFVVHVPSTISPSELNPAAYNPRKISPEKYEALKKSILTEGFIEPIVVQKKGHGIIGGHQRVRAVKEISIEAGVAPPKIPCVVLDIDNARAKKLNIKLNAIKGDFEARMLGELLVDIYHDDGAKLLEADAAELGFEFDEAQKYVHLIEPETTSLGEPEEAKAFGRNPTLSLEFASAGQRDQVKKLLAERAPLEKKTNGELVAEALGLTKKKATIIPPPLLPIPAKTKTAKAKIPARKKRSAA